MLKADNLIRITGIQKHLQYNIWNFLMSDGRKSCLGDWKSQNFYELRSKIKEISVFYSNSEAVGIHLVMQDEILKLGTMSE